MALVMKRLKIQYLAKRQLLQNRDVISFTFTSVRFRLFGLQTPTPCVRLVVTLIKSSFIEQRAREE